MAIVLKLVRGAVTLSFMDGQAATGWQLDGDGWSPRIVASAEPVLETVRLTVRGSSQDNLATQLRYAHAMQTWADAYRTDPTEQVPVWFHAKLANESGERRALVRQVEMAESASWFGPDATACRQFVTLSITRGPWEMETLTTSVTASGISCLGGVFDYTATGPGGADIVGDLPARVGQLSLVSAYGTLENFWFGFRSANKHGVLANFRPVWEFEDGLGIETGDDASLAADDQASPGGGGNTLVQIDFATTPTWRTRWEILPWAYPSAVAPADNFGKFLLLLRARVDSGTVAEVKLTYGYAPNAKIETPAVRVTSSFWTIHDGLQTVTLPPRGLRMPGFAAGLDGMHKFTVWARRVSGTGKLYLDCLVAIPADEYLFTLRNGHLVSGSTTLTAAVTREGNPIAETVYAATNVTATSEAATDPPGGGVPLGDGRAYLVAAWADNVHTLADTVAITAAQFYQRFMSLRGAN